MSSYYWKQTVDGFDIDFGTSSAIGYTRGTQVILNVGNLSTTSFSEILVDYVSAPATNAAAANWDITITHTGNFLLGAAGNTSKNYFFSSTFADKHTIRTLTISSNSSFQIGARAFSGMTAIRNLVLTNVSTLGSNAFGGCTNLTNVSVGVISNFSTNAFNIGAYNSSVSSFPNPNTIINKLAFGSATLLLTQFINMFPGLQQVDFNTNIPETAFPTVTAAGPYYLFNVASLTSIGGSATSLTFNNVTNTTTINMFGQNVTRLNFLGSSITSIGANAFRSTFTDITLSTAVATIASTAFSECTTLTINAASTIATIPASSFSEATGLKLLSFANTSIQSIGTNAIPTSITEFQTSSIITSGFHASMFNGTSSLPTSFTLTSNTTMPLGNFFITNTKNGVVNNISGSTTTYSGPFSNVSNLIITGNFTSLPKNPFANMGSNTYSPLTKVDLSGSKIVFSDSGTDNYPLLEPSNPANENGFNVGTITPNFPGSITSFLLPTHSGCTYIPQAFFQALINLKSITIPANIKSIGGYAFHGCRELTSITISGNINSLANAVFRYCAKVQSISFPNGSTFTTINDATFSACRAMTSLNLPNSVATIHPWSFVECAKLTQIAFNNSTTGIKTLTYETQDNTMNASAFNACNNLRFSNLRIKSTKIPYQMFYDCHQMTNIQLSSNLTELQDSSFTNCYNLTGISITDDAGNTSTATITNLPNNDPNLGAFTNCSKLPRVNSLKFNCSLPPLLFSNCPSLTEINLGVNAGTSSISSTAFSGCSTLTINTDSAIATIPAGSFTGCTALVKLHINAPNVRNIVSGIFPNVLTEIGLSSNVTSIASNAFVNNSVLTINNDTGNGITSIPAGSFTGCTALANLFINAASVRTIGTIGGTNNPVFHSALTSIALPVFVTNIHSYAFSNCTRLTINSSSEITAIPASSFINCSNMTFFRFGTSYLTSITAGALPTSINYIESNFSISTITNFNANMFNSTLTSTSFTFGGSSDLISVDKFFQGAPGVATGIFNNISKLTITGNISKLPKMPFSNMSGTLTSVDLSGSKIVFSSTDDYSLVDPVGNIVTGFNTGTSTPNFPGSITSFLLPTHSGCTYIPLGFFQAQIDLKSITIPSNIKSIGSYAFHGCRELTSITIGGIITSLADGVFRFCVKVQSISFPDSVTAFTSLGDAVFASCSNMSTLNLPNTVTTMISYAFWQCDNLTQITFGGTTNVKTLTFSGNEGVFGGCYKLSFSNLHIDTAKIPSYMFTNCQSMASISLSSRLTEIQEASFRDCYNLIGINIYDGVNSATITNINYRSNVIGSFTNCTKLSNINNLIFNCSLPALLFSNCLLLTEIKLGVNATSITNTAFTNCSTLTINSASGITRIPDSSFSGATSLKSLNIATPNVQTIGATAFPSVLTDITLLSNVTSINTSAFNSCSTLTINSASGITRIPDSSFSQATSLKSLNIATTNVKTIGATAFPSVLTDITLASGVTSIASNAFVNSSTLTINSGSGITRIPDNSFSGATSLNRLNIATPNVQTIGATAFPSVLTDITLASGVVTITSDAFINCSTLTINSNSGITRIPDNSFSQATSLNRLNIATTNVQTIGATTFPSVLTDITLTSGVTSITNTAFSNCSNLTINSASGITKIPNASFKDCINLTNMTISSNAVNVIDTDAFLGCSNLVDMVFPSDSLVYPHDITLNQNCFLNTKFTRDCVNRFLNPNSQGGYNYSQGDLLLSGITYQTIVGAITCFGENTKIMCYVDGQEKEVLVQNIRNGMLVKTSLNGYKPVHMIGTSKLYNPGNKERYTERLYVCKKEKYPEITEDLIITGCHSILVGSLTEEQRANLMRVMKDIYVTEQKYRLIASLDDRAEPYACEGEFNIYHFALENDNYYRNYGVYANGLLVESCSKRYLKELSKMTIIE